MKAYKVFDPNWKCRDFQYELGKTYECNEAIPCKTGFHACLKLIDCFQYYDFNPANKVAIVEMGGTVAHHDEDSKVAATKITILKELSWHQVLELVNTGKDNTGHYNSGNSNSGHYNSGNSNSGNSNSGNSNSGSCNSGRSNSGSCNSGHYNSGHSNSGNSNSGNSNSGSRNSGNSNSGHYNSGNYNSGHSNSGNSNSGHWNIINNSTGCFNTEPIKTIKVFDNEISIDEFSKVRIPNFCYFNLIENGKTLSYHEAWKKSWDKANQEDRDLIKKIPGFTPEKFFKISGIQVS